jgi:hypothetical protein
VTLQEKRPNFRKITLTSGKSTLVDVADFNWLNQWKWRAIKDETTGKFYANRAVFLNGKVRNLSMHRLILGLDFGDQRLGDHRDSHTLDNRRFNLRIATQPQNAANRRKRRDSRSKYKGVGWQVYGWRARIMFQGKSLYLGFFSDPLLAAQAYDQKAVELFGDFARLNFPKKRVA